MKYYTTEGPLGHDTRTAAEMREWLRWQPEDALEGTTILDALERVGEARQGSLAESRVTEEYLIKLQKEVQEWLRAIKREIKCQHHPGVHRVVITSADNGLGFVVVVDAGGYGLTEEYFDHLPTEADLDTLYDKVYAKIHALA